MESCDAAEVLRIYKEGIDSGQASFGTSIPEWAAWDASHLAKLRFVAVFNDQIAGWVALSSVSSRCVYGGVAEVSVYIGEKFRGQGIGGKLLQLLIEESEKAGFWTLQAGAFSENISSIKLHEKCGFRIIGYREKIGEMNGLWRDMVLLEKRSKKVNYV